MLLYNNELSDGISSAKGLSYLQYLHTEGLPFPRSKRRSMSRALLLFTAGLMMGATCVVSSPGALAPAALAFAGAGGASSPSEVSETLSRSKVSSSTGAGRTGAGWTGAGWTGAGWALDRERGAMFQMCIEDVPKSLLIYNLC